MVIKHIKHDLEAYKGWSITTAISPISWTFQETWNNLNFKGKNFQSFKKFLLLKLILATLLNCWKLRNISANAYNSPKQSCDWTFEQLGHCSVQFLTLKFSFFIRK